MARAKKERPSEWFAGPWVQQYQDLGSVTAADEAEAADREQAKRGGLGDAGDVGPGGADANLIDIRFIGCGACGEASTDQERVKVIVSSGRAESSNGAELTGGRAQAVGRGIGVDPELIQSARSRGCTGGVAHDEEQ